MSTTPLDLLAPGSATVAVLVLLRLTGLVLVAPVFSARTVPIPVRTALVVLFTAMLQPAARGTAVRPDLTPAAAVGEVLIGFAIGLAPALLVGAAEMAGDMIATQTGLSGGSILDPLGSGSTPVLASFLSLFTVTVLLALNAHLGMLEALATSFRALPAGTAPDLERGLWALIGLGGTLFAAGLRFAAPVIAAVMIGNTALAVLSRTAPQLNILSIAFPFQIGLGLFALGAAVPYIATVLGDWPGKYDAQLSTLFSVLAPAGAAAPR